MSTRTDDSRIDESRTDDSRTGAMARSTGVIRPSRTLVTIGAQPAAWTPTIRISGRSARSASATPDSSPPPPHGTTAISRPGTCS